MRLYTAPLSMFGMKVEIAAYEKCLAPEIFMVDYSAATGYSPKHPEVLRVNPKGQVPVLIDGEAEIYDSTQIFEYLEDAVPEPALWPRDRLARAKARQLEHASDEVYFPNIIRLMSLQDDLDGEAANTARAGAENYCRRMESRLATQAFLAGEFSFADIALFMAVVYGERLGAPLTVETPKLAAWRDAMARRSSVLPVMQRLVAYLYANNRFVPDFLKAL